MLLLSANRFGLPADADMILDVRFLPNPYFVEESERFMMATISSSSLRAWIWAKQDIYTKIVWTDGISHSSVWKRGES